MKTNHYAFLASVAMLAALASCQKEVSIPEPSTREVTVTASIPDAGITRVALTQDGSDRKLVKLSWESTDRLTINGETFTIKPGEVVETRVNNAGVYIVQSTDGEYTKKLAVK